ncbi:hypothetical protein L804_05751 [Cryptococcus deuterogattii 2001/935-1]|nr:hypothetical protein L804_05751 [Cryptococcus deuterogattii 2001/935-1]
MSKVIPSLPALSVHAMAVIIKKYGGFHLLA